MKILLLTCLVVLTLSSSVDKFKGINVECIEEVGFVTADLFVLGLDMARFKIFKGGIDAFKLLIEIFKLKKACSSTSYAAVMEEHQKALTCLQNSLNVADKAYDVYESYIENGLTVDLIDEAAHIETTLLKIGQCTNKNIVSFLNEQCVIRLNSIAKTALKLKNKSKKPMKALNQLVALGEHYQQMKEECPFMQ